MKKTLAAVAVLGAFAGTALAADVTLYGKIDAGLNYTHTKTDGSAASDDFSMKSGQNSGSRFGLKGTEQIADGLTVGFQLESGFESDDGSLKYGKGDNDRIFGREARLYVQTNFGEFGFGRMGGLDSGAGSYDLIADASPFGTGWGGATAQMDNYFMGLTSRYDNMITYKSPEFAGLTVVAQASLKEATDADGDEGSHLADRYYAIGLGADYGALTGALTFSMQDYGGMTADHKTGFGNTITDHDWNDKDGYAVTAFGAYDFGVTKVSLGAQYFDNVAQSRGSTTAEFGVDGGVVKAKYGDTSVGVTGYGVILGAITPIAGGSLYTAIGYADYEASKLDTEAKGAKKFDGQNYGIGIGYQYPLSKRTYVYTAASWNRATENEGLVDSKDVDTDTTEVMAGIVHNF